MTETTDSPRLLTTRRGSREDPATLRSPRTRLETRATRLSMVVFVLTAIIVAVVMRGERLPLGGAGSLGALAAWPAAIASGFGFAVAYLLDSRGSRLQWRRGLPWLKRFVDLTALVASVALIANIAVHAVFQVFQLGFIGLTIDPLAGAVLAGAAASTCAYFAVIIGDEVTTVLVVGLVVTGLFTGTLAAMIQSPEATWWQFHFSMLGNGTGAAGYQFNLSLVVTGLLLTTLANFVGRDVEIGLTLRGVPAQRRITILTWEFAAIGLCMMVVGLVPDAVNFPVHVSGGAGMVVSFVAFFLTLLRLVPGLPRDFIATSFTVIAAIAGAIMLWVPIGYYNLTGMETVSAGLLFAWLFLLARTTQAYAEAPRRVGSRDA